MRTPKRVKDTEADALQAAVSTLESISIEGQVRVVSYLSDRYLGVMDPPASLGNAEVDRRTPIAKLLERIASDPSSDNGGVFVGSGPRLVRRITELAEAEAVSLPG